MKVVATGLLLLATAVFVVCATIASDAGSWVGYVRAAAEASMVGALADWFAVTALFRHPLGLPIPHTAIIPRKKDQIGASLGTFVRDHFLTRDVIDARFEELDVPGKVGSFLGAPGRAERLAGDVAVALKSGAEMAQDKLVQDELAKALKTRLKSFDASPILADLVESLVQNPRRRKLVSSLIHQAADVLFKNRDRLRTLLAEKSPWYVPRIVDSKFFEAAFEIHGLLTRLADEDSEDRSKLDKELLVFADRLRTNPSLRKKVERTKGKLLKNKQIRSLSRSVWDTAKRVLDTSVDDPQSELRLRLTALLEFVAERLKEDESLRAVVQRDSRRLAGYLVERVADDVAELVGKTIARWDGEQTSRTLELQVGRDLQFIRINGTIVGGVAGLVIYTIAQLL
jgi:uncharacterized membrane-anchored protein YjiN (DUF445 family)